MSNTLTRQAINHTLHCLLGCSIGEVLGMVIAEALDWHNLAQTLLAIVLAFVVGYSLTYRSYIKSGADKRTAVKGTLATDTVSIVSMEFIDNAFIWLVPGAIYATLSSGLFWWSLAISLAVAFLITVPVNRLMMVRYGIGHNHDDHTHH
jgi:putative flippase GtrA